MGGPSYSRIIRILRLGGFAEAADYLEEKLKSEFNFHYGHKRVLILLYFLGTLERPIKVPQKPITLEYKKTDPLVFWQAIEWLYNGSANSFKARYNEMKNNTTWVLNSEDDGIYAITPAGIKVARECLEYERACRDFLFELIHKIYNDDSKQARFFRHILSVTGNFHPIEEEKISLILGTAI